MYLYKCDICGYMQKSSEDKFFHITKITGDGPQVDFDFCLKCYERFQNSEDKKGDKE